MEHDGEMNRMLGVIAQYRWESFIASVVMTAAVVGAAVLHFAAPDAFIYFGDAVSHIVRARQFIDSMEPGLVNIGTVWLPLPHILLLPFVAVNTLFYSGTAGAFLNIPLLTAAAVILFRAIAQLAGSRTIAVFFTLLFCLNPNILYMALTPMNEVPLLFFLAAGGAALMRFVRTQQLRWFMLSSVSVLCATLCRYEAWVLPPFLALVLISTIPSSARRLLRSIGAAVIPWLGILFWFLWNHAQYGDPLMFAHWTFDVGTVSVRTSLQDDPLHLFGLFGTAILWIFGPFLAAAGFLMLFSVRRLRSQPQQTVLLLFFLLPAVAAVSAVMLGFVQMDRWWWNWRFVLPFGLLLTLSGALALKELVQKVRSPALWGGVMAAFCIVPCVQLFVSSGGVALYNDAFKSYDVRSRSAAVVGTRIGAIFTGDTVALLTGYGLGQRIMINSRLPLEKFMVLHFTSPADFPLLCRYIVLGKDRTPESAEFSLYWDRHRIELMSAYSILLEDAHFVLLQRRQE
jgi:hypothetical protein